MVLQIFNWENAKTMQIRNTKQTIPLNKKKTEWKRKQNRCHYRSTNYFLMHFLTVYNSFRTYTIKIERMIIYFLVGRSGQPRKLYCPRFTENPNILAQNLNGHVITMENITETILSSHNSFDSMLDANTNWWTSLALLQRRQRSYVKNKVTLF